MLVAILLSGFLVTINAQVLWERNMMRVVVMNQEQKEEEIVMITSSLPQGFQDCALIVTSPATTRYHHHHHHCYHQVPLKNQNFGSKRTPTSRPMNPSPLDSHDPPGPLIYCQYQTISSAMSITMKPDCHIDQ